MRRIKVSFKNLHLTSNEIIKCRQNLEGIIIAPFEFEKAKGIGYNLSLSEMIYSITRKRLVPIYRDAQETFFYLKRNETIIALSYEYITTDSCIAGSFHSRVRSSAQGIGSISTTLDPEWKGMLVFSLNNPTKDRIKVVLKKNIDGKMTPVPINTLVVWKVKNKRTDIKTENDVLSLQLDNPPMRIDIWTELTSKKIKLINNGQYQKFCDLVNKLAVFESKPSEKMKWAYELKDLLIDLHIAIESKKSDEEIKASLIYIKYIDDVPKIILSKLESLTMALQENEVLKFCGQKEYLDQIELIKREIDYHLLCNQVEQVHDLIRDSVPVHSYKNKLSWLILMLKNNMPIILATGFFVFILLMGRGKNEIIVWQIICAFIPLINTIILSFFKYRKY